LDNPDDDWVKELRSIGYGITSMNVFYSGEDLEVNDTTTSLYHFAKGIEYYRKKDYLSAQYHYVEALDDLEMRDLVYTQLEYMWYHHFSYEERKAMAYNWNVFKVLPYGLKSHYYIEDGAWNWYFYNAIYRDFLSADLLGYIAVLLSMFIWMVFIIKILFIKVDKLKIVGPLFLLGAFLPILVYVFSDILDYFYAEMGISWNTTHFLYNFINIGMVEELVKLLPWIGVYFLFKKHFQRPVHFMLLPIVSALGFAFSENLIYINSEDYEILFTRSTICVAVHISCSSVIGYAYYRGMEKKNNWITAAYVFVGFILASLIHGLYDYFLFINMRMLNIIVFLIGLHLFILFVNNALNFSKITDKKATLHLRSSGVLLMIGLMLIYSCQYIVIGMEYGSYGANQMFKANIIFALISMIYLVSMFRKIRIRPNVLYQFSFMDVFGQFFTLKDGYSSDTIDYKGEKFKLFAPKTNLFVGSQMPVIGEVKRHVNIQNDDAWVLLKFDKPIIVGNCFQKGAVMKCKNIDQELYMDQVEVILLFIPDIDTFKYRKEHHSSDFKFVGRVYSRPLSEITEKN
jgi:RsiW-degrading membrane proteinase PrsW (M82 family)